jgi:hypothetical protein
MGGCGDEEMGRLHKNKKEIRISDYRMMGIRATGYQGQTVEP